MNTGNVKHKQTTIHVHAPREFNSIKKEAVELLISLETTAND